MKFFTDQTNIKLSEPPLTQMINGIVNEILISGNSAILEFPSNFGDIPLTIANQFVSSNNESAVIFTNPETIFNLNNDYYLIVEDSMPYILRVPIGIKTDSGVKIKVAFPKGTRKSIKNKLYESYERSLVSNDKSVIILASDSDYINFKEGELILGEFKKPKLVIFNNTLFLSKNKLSEIISWCKQNDLQYLIMSSHLSPNYYQELREDIIILPFDNGILQKLFTIDNSINLFFTSPYYNYNSQIISKFTYDQPYHYISNSSIEYVEIENGSILIHCAKEMSQILSTIDVKSMQLKHDILQLINIGYESINSFIPIDTLSRFSECVGARITGKEFCRIINKTARSEDESLRDKIEDLTSTFMTIWNCLDKCNTPLYNRGYSKDNKFSILINELKKNLDKYQKIYIIPTNKQELNVLHRLLKAIFSDNPKLTISSIANINDDHIENSMAILSGNPKLNELYVLNFPFTVIKILTYYGDNTKFVKDLVELYSHVNDYHNIIFQKCITKAVAEIPKIQNYLDKVPSIDKFIKEIPANDNPDVEMDVMNKIDNEVVKKYPDLNDFLKTVDSYKNYKKKFDVEILENSTQNIKKSSSYYVLKLTNINSNHNIISYSSIKTTYSFFIDDELVEKAISEEVVGEIIIKAPGNHNNLLDMLLDIYGLKDNIDYEIINIWEECVQSFERSGLTHSLLYDKYCEYGGIKQKQTVKTWFDGKRMGPDNKKDLEILGNVLGNDYLTTNADYIFEELERIRSYKRILGRKLVKIIASILGQQNDDYEDPFVDIVRENVKNYLFIVNQVKLVQQKNHEKVED